MGASRCAIYVAASGTETLMDAAPVKLEGVPWFELSPGVLA